MRANNMSLEEARAFVDRVNSASYESILNEMNKIVATADNAVASFLRPDAFTIGNKESYDESLADWPSKIGRRPIDDPDFPNGYAGGWVWRSAAAAHAWLSGIDSISDDGGIPEFRRHGDYKISFEGGQPVECDVYGLILSSGWELDVSENQMDGPLYDEFDPFRPYVLLNDSLIVRAY
ncbi:MAG TPA: hypothetical protein VIE65_13775 [Methylobacter sp.]|jgi:hypothetical protein